MVFGRMLTRLRKAILVKTSADAHREIYHVEPTQIDAQARSWFLVSLGQEKLLGTRYMVGGNKGLYSDDYYWFNYGRVVFTAASSTRAVDQTTQAEK